MHAKYFWLLTAAGGCSSASFGDGAGLPWSDGSTSEDPFLAVAWHDEELLPGVGPGWFSPTPTVQGLLLPDRIVATAPGAVDPRWSVSLATVAWGRPDRLAAVPPGERDAHGPGSERRHRDLTEWTEGTPRGIEHGYRVERPPPGRGPLAVELDVGATGGDPEVWLRGTGDGVLVAVGGQPRIGWAGLRAWDATDHPLAAWLEADGSRVRILVDDTDAVYPVTIDPLITGDPSVVALATGVDDSGLGWSIDSDGDRLIIGDPGVAGAAANGLAAVAYPYGPGLNAPWETWDALDAATSPGLGVSVAIEGNNAAVAVASGHVATFRREPGGWVHEQTFLADGRCANVAPPCLRLDLVDERLIVGSAGSAAGDVAIYTHYDPDPGSAWRRVQTVIGSGSSRLGAAVSGDDRVLAVGAPGLDEVRVYEYDTNAAPYVLAATRVHPDGTGHDYGAAVAVSGSWLAVGAPGSREVFLYQSPHLATPEQTVRIDAPSWAAERFGASLALHQRTLVVTDLPTDPEVPPRLYVYEHAGRASWELREAFDLAPGAGAPLPVTISDGMIAVGEPHTASFRAFRRSGDDEPEWVHTISVDGMGPEVSGLTMDDDQLVLGVPWAAGAAIPPLPSPQNTGGIVVHRREGDDTFTRMPPAVLTGGGANTFVGAWVDLDGDLVAAGAGGTSLVKVYDIGVLGAVSLTPAEVPDPAVGSFGWVVAVDSYTVVVGTPSLAGGAGGAAVFAADLGTAWTWVATIDASADGAVAGDNYGWQLAVNGGDIYVGSEYAQNGGNDRGEVRLYRLDDQLEPVLVQRWQGTVDNERFGAAIAVDGDRLVVGRPGANGGAGGVSVFRGLDTTPEWSWESTDAGAGYGEDVAVAGDLLYVGSCSQVEVQRFERPFNRSEYVEDGVIAGGCSVDAAADMVALKHIGYVSEVSVYERVEAAPPVARPDAAATVEGGPDVSLAVLENDLDPNGDPISLVSVETLSPAGANHVTVSGDRLLFRPPDPDYDLSQIVRYTIDAGGDQVTGQARFDVTPVNDCPVAQPDTHGQVPFDLEVSFDEVLEIEIADLLANDVEIDSGDYLSLASFDAPTRGTLVRDGEVLRYTPTATPGEVTFAYRVEDTAGCEAEAEVTLVVVNHPPEVLEAPAFQLEEDDQLVLGPPGLLSGRYVADAEDDPLVATLLVPPDQGHLILAPNGALLYTPPPEHVGTVTFTYGISDPYVGAPIPVVATLVYEPVNDPPVAEDDAGFTTPEDRSLRIPRSQLLLNDSDVDSGILEIRLDANFPPSAGTAVIDSEGDLLYTPPPDVTGDVTVWYMAFDGQATSEPAAISIAIEPLDDAPVASNWDYGQIVGPVSDDLLAPSAGGPPLVTDADGDTLVFLLVNAPGNGTVQLNGSTFTYAPDPGYSGTDRFWYAARDEAGNSSAPAKVEFVIFQDPLPGQTEDPTGSEGCAAPTRYYLDADADGFGTELFVREVCGDEVPERYVPAAGDCDDTRPDRNPRAPEYPDDGVDQDCDGRDNVAEPIGACSTTGGPQGVAALAFAALLALARRRSA